MRHYFIVPVAALIIMVGVAIWSVEAEHFRQRRKQRNAGKSNEHT